MHRRGFTIIEVLLVIVVMGTLALIITIGYQNVSKSVRKGAIEKTVIEYKKALETYALKNGKYPNTISGQQTAVTCLGTVENYGWYDNPQPCYDFIAKNGGSATDLNTFWSRIWDTSQDLKPILRDIPTVGTECNTFDGECAKSISFVVTQAGSRTRLDGAYAPYFMVYFFSTNGKCEVPGSVGGTYPNFSSTLNAGKYYQYDATSGVTMCVVSLPNANSTDSA